MDTKPSEITAALLEDFKSHWQSLIQLESEVSRWTTLYAGAVVLGAAASFNDNIAIGRDPESLLKHPVAAAALLLLASVNAVYMLALVFKGYQCQILRLYLYDVLGVRIRALTDNTFNSFELWQRCNFSAPGRQGKPEAIRIVFYVAQTMLPFVVSILLLYFFWRYGFRSSPTWRRGVALAAVLTLTLAAIWFGVSTSATNARWSEIVQRDSPADEAVKRAETSTAEQTPPAH